MEIEKEKTEDNGNEVHKMSISVDDGRESVGEYIEKKNKERENSKSDNIVPKENMAEKDKETLKNVVSTIGQVPHFVSFALGGGIMNAIKELRDKANGSD